MVLQRLPVQLSLQQQMVVVPQLLRSNLGGTAAAWQLPRLLHSGVDANMALPYVLLPTGAAPSLVPSPSVPIQMMPLQAAAAAAGTTATAGAGEGAAAVPDQVVMLPSGIHFS